MAASLSTIGTRVKLSTGNQKTKAPVDAEALTSRRRVTALVSVLEEFAFGLDRGGNHHFRLVEVAHRVGPAHSHRHP